MVAHGSKAAVPNLLDTVRIDRSVAILADFIGIAPPESALLKPHQIRLGQTPVRLELFTSILGVEFSECCARRSIGDMDGVPTPFIGLADLRIAKRAAGRMKDLADLEGLPPVADDSTRT